MCDVKFIGIAGGSASGKSTLAKTLSCKFGFYVPVISQDWFYNELTDKSLGPTHNWDSPSAFDVDAIAAAITTWKSGNGVHTPRHNYSNYTRIHNVEWIKSAPIMIFEGILAYYDPRIAALIDYKIFIDCDIEAALERRIVRDETERGYTREEICARFEAHVRPSFEQYVVTQKKTADLTIPNGNDRDPSMLVALDIISTGVCKRGREKERTTDKSRRWSSR